MTSLDEIKKRILTVARRENIINDDEFKSTKPVFNIDNNLVPLLENINYDQVNTLNVEKGIEKSMTPNESGFIDPTTLSTIIEQRTRGY